MTKAPRKPPPKDEDEAQSKRFMDLANELEAAGDLSLTEGEGAFERAIRKAIPQRRPKAT
jgi:hypothetical protein